jgi:hypothetical protein
MKTGTIVFSEGKWQGRDEQGRILLTSVDQDRVRRVLMKKHECTNVQILDQAQSEAAETQSQWPINQRFDFLSQLVRMVGQGNAVSLIVTGPGGLGKTHTVREGLLACGLKEATVDGVNAEGTFKIIKGYSTAKGLFRELYQNRDSVLVFDDCDDVLKDATALNLLKGALDSYDRRIISWNADMRDDDLERSFQFNGRVIFISNLNRDRMDAALKTRAYCVDLAMSLAQKIERMQVLAASDDFMPRASRTHKADALALIQQLGPRCREVSLRTLQAVTRIRAAGGAWRELAEYTLTN